MAEDFGLRVSPAHALQQLLRQYPSGGQILTEALQNAEDNTLATSFAAMLDCRRHPVAGLRDSRMAQFQGPALLLYDDGGFDEQDWKSLKNMYASEKKNRPGSIGQFGMGSRSFFHISSLFQIVSGSVYAALDPGNMVSDNFGFRRDFVKEPLPADERAPFCLPPFGCDMMRPLQGSVIRLALRCEGEECSFGGKPFSMERAEELFGSFAEQLSDGLVGLFLERVRTVRLYVWRDGQDEPEVLKCADWRLLPELEATKRPATQELTRAPRAFLCGFDTYEQLEGRLRSLAEVPDAEQALTSVDQRLRLHVEPTLAGGFWVTMQFSLEPRALQLMRLCSAVPLIGIAFPQQQHLGFAGTLPFDPLAPGVAGPAPAVGRLFCYLPLPLETGLPVHVHAGFKVMDNRRNLWRAASDLEGDHKEWAAWNELFLRELIPMRYACCLRAVVAEPRCSGWAHSSAEAPSTANLATWALQFWPDPARVLAEYQDMLPCLVEHLASDELLPNLCGGELVAANHAVFLEVPEELEDVRGELLGLCSAVANGTEPLSELGRTARRVVDAPPHVRRLLCCRQEGCRQKQPDWLFQALLFPALGAGVLGSDAIWRPLLAVCDWAGRVWPDERKAQFGLHIREIPWVPVPDELQGYKQVREAFDPEAPPPLGTTSHFKVVHRSTPTVKLPVHALSVLRGWGLKQELTWEDALSEATLVTTPEHGARLYEYICDRHRCMQGAKLQCLPALRRLPWVPGIPQQYPTEAVTAVADPPCGAPSPMCLEELFPASDRAAVWAVAPTSARSSPEGVGKELMPGRSLSSEPEVLLKQIRALTERGLSARDGSEVLEEVGGGALLAHISCALRRFCAVQAQLQERDFQDLRSRTWVPCAPVLRCGVANGQLLRFRQPKQVAFEVKHALEPRLGRLHDVWATEHRKLLQMAGVCQRFSRETLVAALQAEADKTNGQPLHGEAEGLMVRLCQELAAVLSLGGSSNAARGVPIISSSRLMLPAETVFMDDAPWHGSGQVATLHAGISAEDGRALGCSSVREEMARRCEEVQGVAHGDPFGQEEDLVDRVKQLLREYHEKDDVFKEFFQNCDDSGAEELCFWLDCRSFGKDSVVDARCADLQGPAIYVGSSKTLVEEDIRRMQRVGHSSKRADFSSAGRFGVGMNTMYRWCDCPQLFALDRVHFFDVSRSFVAKDGEKRGRRYNFPSLLQEFPDSAAPFKDFPQCFSTYPTIFRLALRVKQGTLGEKTSSTEIDQLLRTFGRKDASQLLILSRGIRKLSFAPRAAAGGLQSLRPSTMQEVAVHTVEETSPDSAARYLDFLKRLPRTNLPDVLQVQKTPLKLVIPRRVTTTIGIHQSSAVYVVAHTVSGGGQLMQRVREAFTHPSQQTALLPHGAVAVCLDPPESKSHAVICSYLPIGQRSPSSLLVHGCFDLHSSRKHVPLPESAAAGLAYAGCADRVQASKCWNRDLLAGPVAQSIVALLLDCRRYVDDGSMSLKAFFEMLPKPEASPLAECLSRAVVEQILKEQVPVFPVVVSPSGINEVRMWLTAKEVALRHMELEDGVQDLLIEDGMKLAWLPPNVRDQLSGAEGAPEDLTAEKLSMFLRGKVARDASLHLFPVGYTLAPLACLRKPAHVHDLLRFCVRGLWMSFVENNKLGITSTSTRAVVFDFLELQRTPLLPLNSHVALFPLGGASTTYFNTGRELLPHHGEMFLSREAVRILNHVDRSVIRRNSEVELRCHGVRPFTPRDLLRYREEVHERGLPKPAFGPTNVWLSSFWSLLEEYWQSEMQLLPDFGEWLVLPVWREGQAALAPVKEAKVTVDLACFDVSQQDGLRKLLLAAGISLLEGPVRRLRPSLARLLQEYVVSSCDGLLRLLHSERALVSRLTGSVREVLLEFLSRCNERDLNLQLVRALPLFKLPNGGFTDLCSQGDVKYFSILSTDPRALSALAVPRVVQLAQPSLHLAHLYNRLGAGSITSAAFLTKYVLPHLPRVAEKRDISELHPYLSELWAFMRHSSGASHVAWGQWGQAKEITEEAKKVPFIWMVNKRAMLKKPEGCCNPSCPAAAHFRDELADEIPHDDFSPKWTPLLIALGMRSSLSHAHILTCAQALDVEASGGDKPVPRVQERSQVLVNELASALKTAWTNSGHPNVDDVAVLYRAAGLRILLVKDASQDDRLRDGEVQRRMRKDAKERSFPGTESLHAFEGVLFGEAQLVWTQAPTAAAGPKAPLEDLCKHFQLKLHQHLGTFLKCAQLTDKLLLKHHEAVCRSLWALPGGLPEITRGSFLWGDMEKCFELVKSRSENDRRQQLLSLWRQIPADLPCVPTQVRDASDKPLQTLRLVPKAWAFTKKLHPPALRQYWHKTFKHLGKDFWKALGVQEKPAFSDCIALTGRIAATCVGDGQAPLQEAEAEVLRTCASRAAAALQEAAAKGVAIVTGGVLHLVDQNNIVRPAQELVWLDRVRWQERVSALPDRMHLHVLHGRYSESETNRRLQACGLQPVSAIVEERLRGEGQEELRLPPQGAETSSSPADLQQRIERFLREDALALGWHSILAHERNAGAPLDLKYEEIADALRRVQVQWKETLCTALYPCSGAVFGQAEDGAPLENSSREPPSFLHRDPAGRLELVIGVSSLSEGAFFGSLASNINDAVEGPIALKLKNEAVLIEMLKCALDGGPARIEGVLADQGIRIASEPGASTAPGVVVPPATHCMLANSMLAGFECGETVAVLTQPGDRDLGEHNSGGQSYIFGRIMEFKRTAAPPAEGARSAGEAMEGAFACEAGADLMRKYRVDLGGPEPEIRRHFEIYKIERGGSGHGLARGSQLVGILGEGPRDVDAAAGSDAPGAGETWVAELRKLKVQLKQMAGMRDKEYKQCCRRLYLRWHPDKAPGVHDDFFRLIRRHADWYEARQKGEAVPQDDDHILCEQEEEEQVPAPAAKKRRTDDVAPSPSWPSAARPQQPREPPRREEAAGRSTSRAASWFEEFDQEQSRNVRWQRQWQEEQRVHGGSTASSARLFCGIFPTWGPVRRKDSVEAGLLCTQASHDLQVAVQLMQEGGRSWPAHAAFFCQQAAEKTIKGVMLRTCGITSEEEKGKGCHDVAKLAASLRSARAISVEELAAQQLPACDADLVFLASAYVNTRYTRPANPGVPSLSYSEGQAQEAICIARALQKWATEVEALAAPVVDRQQPAVAQPIVSEAAAAPVLQASVPASVHDWMQLVENLPSAGG